MQKTILVFIFGLLLLLSITPTVSAQDVAKLEYGVVVSYDFKQDGEQAFYQFEGNKGDVVYVLAELDTVAIGLDIDIDLRDSVGRSIGQKEEYFFRKIILAELPSSATYTAVLTFKGTESTVKAIVGKSGYLSEKPLQLAISDEGFIALFGVKVDKDGNYRVSVARNSGTLFAHFRLMNFDPNFILSEDLIVVGGTKLSEWSGLVELKRNVTYIGFVGSSITLLSRSGSGKKATYSITLTSDE